jgi:hypothetical protein
MAQALAEEQKVALILSFIDAFCCRDYVCCPWWSQKVDADGVAFGVNFLDVFAANHLVPSFEM